MEQGRDNRIMSLVRSCADMEPEGRERFLDRECSGDDELRHEVELRVEERTAQIKPVPPANVYEDILPDYYRINSLLGTGGMASVYLADDIRLNRRVAIKFLNDQFRKDPDRVRRFKQEARSASALESPQHSYNFRYR